LKCSMANLFDFPFDYEKLEQSYTPRKHKV
jgi:hypothetical protein